MAKSTQGVIINYRVGPRSQASKECIVQFAQIPSVAKASEIIGRKLAWKSGECRIIGRIVALHGKRGFVRARFRKGLPGQALGTTVELTA
jgi:large subunit ribosomal protein L35Ae